jgi:hypothetical protein
LGKMYYDRPMALTCNIDARGKFARLISGIVMVILAVLLAWFWAVPDRSVPGWTVSSLCAAGGGFAIFEARAGWCVMRAIGFKTRL